MIQKVKKIFDHIMLNPTYVSTKKIEQVLKKSKLLNCNKILDVGCGDKKYHKLFSSSSYIGLEYPSNTEDHPVDIKLPDIWGDARKLPFKDNYFEALICFQVLEHIPETSEIIQEFNRVLMLDGKLIISVPHSYRIHESPYDFWRFTKYGLIYLLLKNGFEIIQIEPTTNSFYNAWNILLTTLFQPNVKCTKLKIAILTLTMYFLKLTVYNMDDQKEWENPVDWIVIAKKSK
ncbi:methyltransferase domain-containing protein [Methanoplanus endosymbiosus]|uniref:Class I SAM-dependent methyltransferase n=1 Tax=Methanoplanus endosymbiosus TaxID=33865 RepID=A0A9E7PKC6_9EURY|nr:class I SAM-dependent methyltransferase [Methanoplanus endosymbiosus]UUX91685.1 class I SAM-dependent methyltransferase [Methanoplanus endosymbiosus]